jgi:hypothetical protein
MSDLINDPKLHSALVTGIVSSGVWLARYLVKREISRNDHRILAVERAVANAVKRSELERFRADLKEEHVENVENMRQLGADIKDLGNKIDTAITGTHKRIDDLFRTLPEMLKK